MYARRDLLKLAGLGGISCLVGRESSFVVGDTRGKKTADAKLNRPNFIFILTDDQRYDAMGCSGNALIHTPNIDSLAARGVRFEKAFVTLSICSPSRAACLTGRYGSANGVTSVPGTLNKDEKTICHYLKDAGYRTGMVGKWHLGNSPAECGLSRTTTPKERLSSSKMVRRRFCCGCAHRCRTWITRSTGRHGRRLLPNMT